jgi:hypothetical protein
MLGSLSRARQLGWEGESLGLTSLTLALTRKDEDTLPMDDGETACRLPPPGSAGSSSSARRAARVAHNLRVPLPSARVVHARQRREHYVARAGRYERGRGELALP